jgi:broad specificity phosphatase PhoE
LITFPEIDLNLAFETKVHNAISFGSHCLATSCGPVATLILAGGPMEIVLVRHGQAVALTSDGPPVDPPLSELGQAQAALVGRRLVTEPFDWIVTSPKQRALETVRVVLDAQSAVHTVDTELDEKDRWSRCYIPPERIEAEGGAYWDAIVTCDWSAIGWDTPEIFEERVRRSWTNIENGPLANRVLVATHGGVIRLIVANILGMPAAFGAEQRRLFSVDYASITRILVGSDRTPILATLNDTSHLSALSDR